MQLFAGAPHVGGVKWWGCRRWHFWP